MRRGLQINQDVIGGLMFIGFGALFLYFNEYQVGTSRRMGPGYMPMLLGWSLVGIGAFMAGKGIVTAADALEKWDLRPLIFIVGAFVLFSQTIERLGLPTAVILTMIVGALADTAFRAREQVPLSLATAVAAILLFIWGLSLPMRIWPVWLDPIIYSG
jgi:hypothetical protein